MHFVTKKIKSIPFWKINYCDYFTYHQEIKEENNLYLTLGFRQNMVVLSSSPTMF